MDLEPLRSSIGPRSRRNWTHCGFERRPTHEKATRSQPPADGSQAVPRSQFDGAGSLPEQPRPRGGMSTDVMPEPRERPVRPKGSGEDCVAVKVFVSLSTEQKCERTTHVPPGASVSASRHRCEAAGSRRHHAYHRAAVRGHRPSIGSRWPSKWSGWKGCCCTRPLRRSSRWCCSNSSNSKPTHLNRDRQR
jgi:hypothetical protein